MRRSFEDSSKDGETANVQKTKIFGVNLQESIFENKISPKTLDDEITMKRFSHQESDKKPSILLMENEWTTYSSIGVQRKILEENTKKIKNFMNSLAVPSWYRGVSIFQKKAADLLRNAIRDDYAQRTVYRTMKCLGSIGLDPLPTKKQLHKILPLCGGSDLALLWFLMEWLYRDKDSDSYSVNEQLIMSSIAHLDMNTTIGELDRILPPKQDTRKEMSLRKRNNLQNESQNNKKHKNENTLPYFEKLPQRRPTKRRSIEAAKSSKTTLNFCLHDLIDTSHATANRDNRWFQSNNFEDRNRAIHDIEDKEISKLLENFEAAMAEENKVNEMCGQHQNIELLKKSFNTELDAIAKKKTEELEQIFERKQQNYTHLISRLHYDIEKYRHEFYTLAENSHKHLSSSESALFPNYCDVQMGQQSYDKRDSAEDEGKKKYLSQKSSPTEINLKPSEISSESDYFAFSQNYQPLKFNYCKIFAWEDNHLENLKIPSALGNSTESYISEKETVTKHEVMEFTTIDKGDASNNVVDYGLDYYDPEDDELMDRMLKDALDIMKKDHKFVFASIPAAHRFPMLREWIRLRYGKKYKRTELSRCFQESKPIFTALAKVGLPVELPSNDDMGSNLITNYSCRDYVIQKCRYIRNQFYNRINKAMLAQSRVIYFAMHHCSSAQPYNTIFAYMPAHKRENYHFRPWKLGESLKQTQFGSLEVMHNEITRIKRTAYKSGLK